MQKDEIKEILSKMERLIVYGQYNAYYDLEKQLLDYITNLQEENKRLKQLCDKYEEEHSTTFNEWKETITDKYQTLKDLQEEIEKLTAESTEWEERTYCWQDTSSNLQIKIDKAIEYIMTELISEWDIENDGYVSGSDLPVDAITPLLNILNGDDEE